MMKKGNLIDDEGASGIAKGLENSKSLETILLDGNLIAFAGVIAISDSLKKNYVLQKISLRDNLIDGQGAIQFCGNFIFSKNIKHLDLRGKKESFC